MIVVDSSVLVAFFRGADTANTRELARLEQDQIPYAIPGVCLQEVLQGARDESEWAVLHDYLSAQSIVGPQSERDTHIAAARLYYDCRRRGLAIRSTIDCAIAQLCLERDAALLHDDTDFERIASVAPLRRWWPREGEPGAG
ncbi:MAG: PIN domain-containing protein [Myxococcota bacterium]